MSVAKQMQQAAEKRRQERLKSNTTNTSPTNTPGQSGSPNLQDAAQRKLEGSNQTQYSKPTPASTTLQNTRQPTQPSSTTDNFGKPSQSQYPSGSPSLSSPGGAYDNGWQYGSVSGDEGYTTEDQIRQRVADIRKHRGLAPDPESDQIWVDRVLSGQRSIGDARTAITGKAMKRSEPAPVGEEQLPETPVSWDFSPEYSAGMNQAEQQAANLRSQEELERRRLAEDSQIAQERVNEGREDALKANMESMADRGLVHSGINIGEQAEIGEEHVKFSNEINRARARGEEDLARFLTQQYQQIENYKAQLEMARAREQEQAEKDRALHEAINATPQPTAAGRYDLSFIRATDSAREQASGNDLAALETGNDLASRLEAIFNHRNVPIAYENETDAERIARIAQEVASGNRTFDDVRESVDRIARGMNL